MVAYYSCSKLLCTSTHRQLGAQTVQDMVHYTALDIALGTSGGSMYAHGGYVAMCVTTVQKSSSLCASLCMYVYHRVISIAFS